MNDIYSINRRELLLRSAALGTAAALPWSARAAGYPEKDIEVLVATRAGGGADRTLRAISAVWENYLGVKLKPGFYPGASGQVGYAVFTGKREPDAYSILYGNMGPELIGWVLQKPSYQFRVDWNYVFRTDTDPSVIFVRKDSPFKSIEEVVAAAKKRTLTVGTSRLPHPASIGTLALGEATGAKFNLIPLSGGNKTIAGVMTGEVDIGTLPAGVKRLTGDQSRVLCVFDTTNPRKAELDNAPMANEVFGSKIPALPSSRAFAVHTKTMTDHPDRVKFLIDTLTKTFADPALAAQIEKNKLSPKSIAPGSQADCDAYADGIIELAKRYEPLLTGKKKKKA